MDKYHEWMKSPFLQEMTGSEPLTLDEEIEMQQSWRDDPEKCTFIVLARELCSFKNDEDDVNYHDVLSSKKHLQDDPEFPKRNINAMIGDVNLFLSEIEEEEEEEDGQTHMESTKNKISSGDEHNKILHANKKNMQAELDIMIAEESFRKKGMGREAALLMMIYGSTNLGIQRFFVKINEDNTPSINLFENAFGFVQCNYAACFKQVELELKYESPEKLLEYLLTGISSKIDLSEWRCSLLKDDQ